MIKTFAKAIPLSALMLFVSISAYAEEDTFKDCDDCPEMVVIPSGEAMIGVEEFEANRKYYEFPMRKVKISYSLAVGKTEITRGQYREFVSDSGYETPNPGCNSWDFEGLVGFARDHTWDSPGFVQGDDHPVVCVSYNDAIEYTKWLSKKTGEEYRLLSAAEFEYATRAGTRGQWFWGTVNSGACEYANVADTTFRRLYNYAPVFHCDDGYARSAPVAKFKPNPWGLYDMLGNAWEWTEDCRHRPEVGTVPTDGSPWLAEDSGDCSYRTPKGGDFLSGTDWVRAAALSGDRVAYQSQLLGFRVARVVK